MVQALHDAVVGTELVSPAEFWRLPPGQIWWLISHQFEKHKPTSGLSKADRDELLDWVKRHNAEKEGSA